MSKIDSNLSCPSCQSALYPKVLACDKCNIKVEGPFQLNEFATLSPEDLHFLRIFIRCEGRIREMEPALGLSYPTIRTRLSNLKNKLVGETDDRDRERPEKIENKKETVQDVLELLQKGTIVFDEAMERIKKINVKS